MNEIEAIYLKLKMIRWFYAKTRASETIQSFWMDSETLDALKAVESKYRREAGGFYSLPLGYIRSRETKDAAHKRAPIYKGTTKSSSSTIPVVCHRLLL